jgi:hypothetical protein
MLVRSTQMDSVKRVMKIEIKLMESNMKRFITKIMGKVNYEEQLCRYRRKGGKVVLNGKQEFHVFQNVHF